MEMEGIFDRPADELDLTEVILGHLGHELVGNLEVLDDDPMLTLFHGRPPLSVKQTGNYTII
ncbi:MAG: hypothetical protein HYT15_01310 [Candidatus Magasanikbacteria bacterium]|nr:hypothetical protein [Candidatus Magasanikbacteria bacterium]